MQTPKTKLSTKPNGVIKQKVFRKPEGLPKVVLGGGKNIMWISDTLFEQDLK